MSAQRRHEAIVRSLLYFIRRNFISIAVDYATHTTNITSLLSLRVHIILLYILVVEHCDFLHSFFPLFPTFVFRVPWYRIIWERAEARLEKSQTYQTKYYTQYFSLTRRFQNIINDFKMFTIRLRYLKTKNIYLLYIYHLFLSDSQNLFYKNRVGRMHIF